MAVTLFDANIQGSQLVTAGTTVMISADFYEVNSQAFTVETATATVYNDTGVAVSVALTDRSAVIATGLRSSKRVSVTLNSSETLALSAGQYYIIWTMVLGDNQTRKVKQSIEIRVVS